MKHIMNISKGVCRMELSFDRYKVASNEYETSLTAEFKKNNGVFYTDILLADKMFCAIKKYIGIGSVVLDPCCGAGAFLAVANKYGFTNTYGLDIDKGAIEFCIANIPKITVSTFNFLEATTKKTLKSLDLEDKVDCIIGNPPYVPIAGNVKVEGEYTFRRQVSDMGNNLFVAALLRSLSILKDDGVLSYILPKNFLHVASYSRLRESLLKDYTILSIVDIGSYFKNVRGEQIILTIKNRKPRTKQNKIEIKSYRANRFVRSCKVYQSFYLEPSVKIEKEQSNIANVILLFDDEKDRRIYEHLTNTFVTLNNCRNGYIGRGKSKSEKAIIGNDIRKFGYKTKPLPNDDGKQIFIQNIYSAEAGVIAAYGGKLEASQTVTIFTDSDLKMCRFILGILHSRLCNYFLYRYCYNRSRLTMHTDAKYLKTIPLPSHSGIDFSNDFDKVLPIVTALENDEYLTQKWFEDMERLNNVVYEIYGFDSELAEYIDTEVQKVQSKRWYGVK